MPEYKALPVLTKSISDRTVIGIFAVHGNRDDGGDRSHPGAFADTTIQGRDRAKFLWQHNANDAPTAVINYVRELGRELLPDKVLAFAPDATGAAEVSRTYLETPRGSEILAGIQAGAIDEMSYAYDVLDYKITTDEATGNQTRELLRLHLWDVSDVNHGMNAATVASKRLDWKEQPLLAHAEAVEAAIGELAERIDELKARREKVGRVFSASNYSALEGVAGNLEGLVKELRDLLARAEPKQKQDIRRLWLDYQHTLAALNGAFPQ